MQVRLATPQDAPVLVEFNAAMALETEQKELLPDVIGAGVHSLLGNPAAGFYVVAESEERVVGSLMVTKEWSDWRNGTFWWIQSVYVRPDVRAAKGSTSSSTVTCRSWRPTIRPSAASGCTWSAKTRAPRRPTRRWG